MRCVRWFLAAAVLFLGLGQSAAALAQSADSGLEWSVTPIYGKTYRPGMWVPLRVTIANKGADQRLDVRVSIFSLSLDVPGGGQKTATMYVQLDQTTRVPAALYAGDNKLATDTLEVLPSSDPLVATLRANSLPLLKTHTLVALPTADLPESAIGLNALSAIVIDEQGWNDLQPAQESALREWVQRGGTLVVEGSAVDLLPDDLRPASSSGTASFAGAVLAGQLGYEQPASDFDAAALSPESGGSELLVQDGHPLLVQRAIGSGRVLAVAAALDEPALVAWRGLDRLWALLVPVNSPVSWAGPFATVETIRDSQVTSYLNNLPALDLPPLRTLLILLGVYILLAGPITFLILRRLDRMAWAWVSIPALTLIFAVLAYGFGARQRGTDIIINELAIVETNGSGSGTVQGYVGVFSPIKDTYTLQASPDTLLRPLSSGNWGGGAPAQNGGAARARYSNEPAQVSDLAINQWSMEMLAFALPDNAVPTVELQVTLDGATITGSVRNTSAVPLTEAALLVGGQAIRLDTLQPGEEKPISMRMVNAANQNSTSYLLYQAELDAAYQTPRGPDRDLMAKTQALDTAVPTGYGPTSTDPVFLASYERSTPGVTLVDRRFSRSSRTILVQRATLEYGAGEIELDSRWMQIRGSAQPLAGQSDYCYTARGTGTTITARTNELTLQLPPSTIAIQPSSLRFIPSLDGVTDASKVAYELYNWQTNAWDPVEYRAGFIDPPAGTSYLANGQVKLRYTMPENADAGGGWWGCLSPGLVIKGVLP
jgi:hypothetical protein